MTSFGMSSKNVLTRFEAFLHPNTVCSSLLLRPVNTVQIDLPVGLSSQEFILTLDFFNFVDGQESQVIVLWMLSLLDMSCHPTLLHFMSVVRCALRRLRDSRRNTYFRKLAISESDSSKVLVCESDDIVMEYSCEGLQTLVVNVCTTTSNRQTDTCYLKNGSNSPGCEKKDDAPTHNTRRPRHVQNESYRHSVTSFASTWAKQVCL
ncbi:hypothetical protein ACOMHN_046691 [Nucella lapillus]